MGVLFVRYCMNSKKKDKQFLTSYDEYADAIFRHCSLRVSDRELAQDLTQEAFTRVWNYAAGGGKIKNFRAFLYRVANNLIVDSYRKKKTVSLEVLQEKGVQIRHHTAEGDIKARAEVNDILEFVRKIDEKYREVVIMRYVDELSPKEIAEILNETENAVSVRIHRGLQKVRELLNHGKPI